MVKIAFGGNMGVGKDLCVAYLLTRIPGRKVSFAEPIYDILYYAQKICGFPIEKDRAFLQWVGSEWGRAKNPDVWVDIIIRKSAENSGENMFLSDARFRNEVLALQKSGWICVKITRKNTDIGRSGSGTRDHISETEVNMIDTWNYIIDNDGTIQDLYSKLDALFSVWYSDSKCIDGQPEHPQPELPGKDPQI